MEKWKNLNYEGYEEYQISDHGNVWGKKGLMKTRANSRGYQIVGLRKQGVPNQKMLSVHRMVAEHFIDNPHNKPYVNHIDGNKGNNHVNNLEWCTQSENQKHAYKMKLQEYTPEQEKRLKSFAEKRRRPIRVINKKLGIDRTFKGIYEAGQQLDCNEKTIRNILKNKHKSRLGYEAFYLDE